MKVLAVIANNTDKSRSAAVAREMIRGAEAAGHEVKIFNLAEMPLLGCRNCKACRENKMDCVIRDPLKEYFDELHEAGAVIVASPNYNSQPSGSVITFMNRHYCMLDAEKQPRLDHDVKLLSVFAQGAPAPYPVYEEHYQWFLGCFKTKRLISDTVIVVGGGSDISEGSAILRDAYEAGRNL